MKCVNSRLTRLCALKRFINRPSYKIVKIIENKYNVIASVQTENSIKYYTIITSARYEVIKNRIAYPDRFNNNPSEYRIKILTGYSKAKEHKFVHTKTNGQQQVYYIYELPVEQKINTINFDAPDVIDTALDELMTNPNYINQFMSKIQETLKDVITDTFNRGYEAGYNDGSLSNISK